MQVEFDEPIYLKTFAFSSQEDPQRYYSWQSFGPADDRTEELWVDLSSLHRSQVQIHSILSSSHRKAAVRRARSHARTLTGVRSAQTWPDRSLASTESSALL